MNRFKAQIDTIKSICFRWYIPAVRRKLVTTDGMKISCMSVDNPRESARNYLDKPQKQRAWVREEMVVLVAEYFRTKGLSSQEMSESNQLVSNILRNRAKKNGENISDTFRNISGIQMQTACLIKYDPEMKGKGNKGLSGGSKLMEKVMGEYINNPDRIKSEAYDVICKYYV